MKFNDRSLIALNLKNAKLENLEEWFVETNLISSDATKNYIRQDENNNLTIDYIFLINDTVLGTSYKNDCTEIKFSDFLIDDFVMLKPISLTELELYRSVIIDWIFNYNKINDLVFKAIRSLQEFEADIHQYPNFTSCVCVIDAFDLGFKLNDFFLPTNQKFEAIHQFFKTQYQTEKVLKSVNLTKVFFLDQFILGFSFQMKERVEEHFFWNMQLDEQLLLMDKITFDATIQLTVDSLLDKINFDGIKSLTIEELNFLSNQ
ncbi:hypothetical protein [Flavobacterium sp.]|uniref:hypothetical protein n=1 Tax=Flavobacterium sp. TaxID=239 RepID=UPI002869ED98|nr:hypothetical protein [Flavobacterium sp.]